MPVIRNMSAGELVFVTGMPECIRKEIEEQVEKGCSLEIEDDALDESSSECRNILLDGVPVFQVQDTS